VWVRLNGGTTETGRNLLPAGVPRPTPLLTKEGAEEVVTELGMVIDALEKKLQDVSKARESRLRKVRLTVGWRSWGKAYWRFPINFFSLIAVWSPFFLISSCLAT
jgi:hypothetical protein